MEISLIVAMTPGRAIGNGGKLPWHYPEDLKWFAQQTTGRAVVMGRRTFASIGNKPLPRRHNIIISHGPAPGETPGVLWVDSVTAALEAALDYGEREVFICGGAQVYAETLPLADRLYITTVDIEAPDADVYFPAFDRAQWQSVFERVSGPLTFEILERLRPGGAPA